LRHACGITHEFGLDYPYSSHLLLLSPNLWQIASNLVHIQSHRRARAIQRLRNAVLAGALGADAIRDVALPLVHSAALDPDARGAAASRARHGEQVDLASHTRGGASGGDGAMGNIVDEAVRAVGAVAGRLAWRDYRSLLWGALREVPLGRPYERALIRLVCAVAENFHFTVAEPAPLPGPDASIEAAGAAAIPVDVEEDALVDEVAGEAAGEEDDDAADATDGPAPAVAAAAAGDSPAELLEDVTRRLLPALMKLVTERPEIRPDRPLLPGRLRPHMALAVVGLLRRLPPTLLARTLPAAVGLVCGSLRSREQGERDAARRTLADAARALGPYYLHYVLREVRNGTTTFTCLHLLSTTTMFVPICTNQFSSLSQSLNLTRTQHRVSFASIVSMVQAQFIVLMRTAGKAIATDTFFTKTSPYEK
jgi:U3 small nucleolar RNA-associated protein 20